MTFFALNVQEQLWLISLKLWGGFIFCTAYLVHPDLYQYGKYGKVFAQKIYEDGEKKKNLEQTDVPREFKVKRDWLRDPVLARRIRITNSYGRRAFLKKKKKHLILFLLFFF